MEPMPGKRETVSTSCNTQIDEKRESARTAFKRAVLTAPTGMFIDTFRQAGTAACLRKMGAAIALSLPRLFRQGRTHSSVNAFFDLVTDETRHFYSDNFHVGYYADGIHTIQQATDHLTRTVAAHAGATKGAHILNVGCGVCAPAVVAANAYGCTIDAVNTCAVQVKQAKTYVAQQELSDRIFVHKANALALPFEPERFDGIMCLEVAGNICVSDDEKGLFIRQLASVLKDGGSVGFCDLAFRTPPSSRDDRIVQMLLHSRGTDLISEWAELFETAGYQIESYADILPHTLRTWTDIRNIYEARYDEVVARYGRRVANQTITLMQALPGILASHATYPLFRARLIKR